MTPEDNVKWGLDYIGGSYECEPYSMAGPSQNDWYSFLTDAGKRSKPHMLALWDGPKMIFACGVQTLARETCGPPMILGVPEFGLPPVRPMKKHIVGHEQKRETGSMVALPEDACGLCAHEKKKAEAAYYEKRAEFQLSKYLRVSKLIDPAAFVKLSSL